MSLPTTSSSFDLIERLRGLAKDYRQPFFLRAEASKLSLDAGDVAAKFGPR